MHNLRAYYSASVKEFLQQSKNEILGIIHSNSGMAQIMLQQCNTREEQIDVLKNQLKNFEEGHVIFEYTIPRMGKRVDVVLLYKNIAFLL